MLGRKDNKQEAYMKIFKKVNLKIYILIIVILVLIGLLYSCCDYFFSDVNIKKIDAVISGGKFLFSAEIRYDKSGFNFNEIDDINTLKDIDAKSNLYICDIANGTYSLKYSSEKYNIKYFCVDKEIIYFLGESEGKSDIVKLGSEKEEPLATLEQNAYSIGKIGDKLFFIMGPNEEEIYIYYFDLKTFEIIKYSEKSFIFNKYFQPVFCPDGDILIFNEVVEKNEFTEYRRAYLVRDNETTCLTYGDCLQKYDGKILISRNEEKSRNWTRGYRYSNIFSYYLNTGKTNKIDKYGRFYIERYLDIKNEYGLGYSTSRLKARYFILEQPNQPIFQVLNMKTGKQAELKCLENIYENSGLNSIYCWRWLETA